MGGLSLAAIVQSWLGMERGAGTVTVRVASASGAGAQCQGPCSQQHTMHSVPAEADLYGGSIPGCRSPGMPDQGHTQSEAEPLA
eukprot:COSAG01_NODE_2433_length_7703_cov_64.622173_13_plen_84_part_00